MASTETSHDEALAHKERVARDRAADIAGNKTWHHTVRSDADSAAAFLNENPPQGAGEASLANRSDGQVDVYYFME